MDHIQKLKIVVLGSLNCDIFLKMERLPLLGETTSAENEILKAFGGKGANQAIGAARLVDRENIEVHMLGQIGSDDEGQSYLEYLNTNGVICDQVNVKEGEVTGQAFIMSMTSTGENSIVIVGGANQSFDQELPQEWVDSINDADVLLMQREIPESVNIAAARVAKSGAKIQQTILDVGGVDTKISDDLLQNIDIISPNETELERLTSSISSQASPAVVDESRKMDVIEGQILNVMQHYPNMQVLFKQGEKGCTLYSKTADTDQLESQRRAAFDFSDFKDKSDFKLVDTTGAGDAFTAGYAVGMLEGLNPQLSMELASKTAFLTISRYGAGPAMPTRDEINQFFGA